MLRFFFHVFRFVFFFVVVILLFSGFFRIYLRIGKIIHTNGPFFALSLLLAVLNQHSRYFALLFPKSFDALDLTDLFHFISSLALIFDVGIYIGMALLLLLSVCDW